MSIFDVVPFRKNETGGAVAARREADPFYALHNSMDQLLNDFMTDFGLRSSPAGNRAAAYWPPVEVYESPAEYLVTAELPGLAENEVELTVSEDSLTLKGEKKPTEPGKDHQCRRSERSYGGFTRTIQFPMELNRDKAAATYKNGVLTVTIPKSAQAKAEVKKLEIKTG